MLKKCIFSVILLTLLMVSAILGQGPEVLVRLKAGQAAPAVYQYPIRICFQTDDYLLATIARQQLPRLNQAGIRYQILDENPWTEPYYLLQNPARRDLEQPETGKQIWANDQEMLIKIPDQAAFKLAQKGWRIIRIFDRSLPPIPPAIQSSQALPDYAQPNGLIEDLIAQISDSSLSAMLQRLQDFQTRYSYSDSVVSASKWLRDQFFSFGYTEVVMDAFPMDNTTQNNVIAIKPGTIAPDRIIILGGHYDSVVYDGTDPLVFAPGVDDNGSGTAGTLEIARLLADTELDKTIQFIGFAAEEQGLWGSFHHAEQSFQNGRKIDLVLNMDMIANVFDNIPNMNIYADARSRRYADLTQQMMRAYTRLLPGIIPGSSGGSDHYPYQAYGFAAIFIQEGDFSPHWHLATDVIENVDVSYATEVLKGVLASLVMVAIAPATPSGLIALDAGDGISQVLSWQPNDESDLAGYRIYYGSASGQYTETITTTASSDTLTGLIENQSYFAAVSALDSDGYESILSNEVVFVPRTAPLTPLNLVATSRPKSIELSWSHNNTELDFAGYRVIRSSVDGNELSFNIAPATNELIDTQAQPHVLYRYVIRARDLSGNESAPSAPVLGQLATHDRGILIVDGTRDGNGQPLRPFDEDVDNFYQDILKNFNLAGQWDLADSLKLQKKLTDANLSIYSTLVWHTDVTMPQSRLSEDTLVLKKYLQNGGKLLLSGWGLTSSLTSESAADRIFNPGNFTFDYLKISSAMVASGSERDFIGADAQVSGYPSFSNDPVKVPLFGGNLLGMEALERVADPQTEALYAYRSSMIPPSVRHGQPVAIRYLSDTLSVVVLDFPLFFVPRAEATQLVSQALIDLGEIPTRVKEEPAVIASTPETFDLAQNYPNPFRMPSNWPDNRSGPPVTFIRYEIAQQSHISIKIYNLLGQVVRTLVDTPQKAGTFTISWDGRTVDGDLAMAGIYFYELRAGDFKQVRKMLMIR